MTDFPTPLYTSGSEILPFHIPDAWKRYPFQAEPSRIGHHREYSPPEFMRLTWWVSLWKRFKNGTLEINGYRRYSTRGSPAIDWHLFHEGFKAMLSKPSSYKLSTLISIQFLKVLFEIIWSRSKHFALDYNLTIILLGKNLERVAKLKFLSILWMK